MLPRGRCHAETPSSHLMLKRRRQYSVRGKGCRPNFLLLFPLLKDLEGKKERRFIENKTDTRQCTRAVWIGVHLLKFTLPTPSMGKQFPNNFHCIEFQIFSPFQVNLRVTSNKACSDDCEWIEHIVFPVFIISIKSSDKQMKFVLLVRRLALTWFSFDAAAWQVLC